VEERAAAGVLESLWYMLLSLLRRYMWRKVRISRVTYMLRGMKLLYSTKYVSHPSNRLIGSSSQRIPPPHLPYSSSYAAVTFP